MKNSDLITEKFFSYLSSSGISSSTIKNYKSDIKHFSDWLIREVKSFGVFAESLTDALPLITASKAADYKSNLEKSGIPTKTINRRLSTLRKLSNFFLEQEILSFDFTGNVTNIQLGERKQNPTQTEVIIKEFQFYLEKEKVSKNTIKNYLSDVKQFFAWFQNQNLPN